MVSNDILKVLSRFFFFFLFLYCQLQWDKNRIAPSIQDINYINIKGAVCNFYTRFLIEKNHISKGIFINQVKLDVLEMPPPPRRLNLLLTNTRVYQNYP